MINAIVSGNIGKVKFIKKQDQESGFTLLAFSVASHTSTKTGEEITNWVTGKLWGPRAEALAPHLTKGQAVIIQGKPEARGYSSGNEIKGELSIHVSSFEFIGPKPKNAPNLVQGDQEPYPSPSIE